MLTKVKVPALPSPHPRPALRRAYDVAAGPTCTIMTMDVTAVVQRAATPTSTPTPAPAAALPATSRPIGKMSRLCMTWLPSTHPLPSSQVGCQFICCRQSSLVKLDACLWWLVNMSWSGHAHTCDMFTCKFLHQASFSSIFVGRAQGDHHPTNYGRGSCALCGGKQ